MLKISNVRTGRCASFLAVFTSECTNAKPESSRESWYIFHVGFYVSSRFRANLLTKMTKMAKTILVAFVVHSSDASWYLMGRLIWMKGNLCRNAMMCQLVRLRHFIVKNERWLVFVRRLWYRSRDRQFCSVGWLLSSIGWLYNGDWGVTLSFMGEMVRKTACEVRVVKHHLTLLFDDSFPLVRLTCSSTQELPFPVARPHTRCISTWTKEEIVFEVSKAFLRCERRVNQGQEWW